MQKNYYMFLRASIALYMDDDAQAYYKTILSQEDKRKGLPLEEKYLPGKRIPWKTITEWIYTKMCCHTNGNYYYKTLMTLYRPDGQTRYDWAQLVLNAQEALMGFEHGYQYIGSKDAVEKLWDWLCPIKEQPVMRDYYKRVHVPTYKDTQTILTSVTLEELVKDITVNVDKIEWSTGEYSNTHCKAGRAKLLYQHTLWVESL